MTDVNKQKIEPRKVIIWCLAVAVILLGAAVFMEVRKAGRPVPDKAAGSAIPTQIGQAASAPVPALKTTNELGKVVGRWVRPDGGYILDLAGVAENGAAEAKYYNPNPINISKAVVSLDGGAIKVFVELQDQNYPGCTYKLTYSPENDMLLGVYYQAALQESYNVVFEREK